MTVNPFYHHTNQRLEEELSWIRRAQKDPESFGPLYKKYHEQIFRYIYQRMDDEELAFDITSQVFMKALNNISKYEYRGVPFSSWLYRIAKSELYQAFRDRKAQRTVNIESFHLYEIIEEIDDDHSEEKKRILFDSLAKMKEKDMQLIEMRFFEKRSFREIGEILEITENNAKVKAFRAIEKLNLDRKNLTSTYIELRQDLKPILNLARNTKMTDFKSPWFYGAIGLSSMAIAILFNNEMNSKTEINDETITLKKQKATSTIKTSIQIECSYNVKS